MKITKNKFTKTGRRKRMMSNEPKTTHHSSFITHHFMLWCLLISLAMMVSCQNKKAPVKQEPVAITTHQATLKEASYYDEYPATVTALDKIDIRSQVSGYITGIFFKDGQKVSKGQKLYTIDQQQYKGVYDEAVANLNVAKANLVKAQQDANRYQDLAAKDAIAKQVLDHSMADLNSAQMQVEAAKANVRSVETNLRYSVIYSPLSGTIGISQVKLGTAVTPGVTILNTVSTDNPIAVDFEVNEKEIPRFVKFTQSASAKLDSTFTLQMPDMSIYTGGTGKLVLLDRAVNPQTGTIKARLSFDNSGAVLKDGMNGNVRVMNNGNTQKVIIPYKSVIEQLGEYFVFVVKNNKVNIRKVSLGQALNNGEIIVNQGLDAGEVIVLEGVQKLKDGSDVVVKN